MTDNMENKIKQGFDLNFDIDYSDINKKQIDNTGKYSTLEYNNFDFMKDKVNPKYQSSNEYKTGGYTPDIGDSK